MRITHFFFVAISGIILLFAQAAYAHPHVWVKARVTVLFDADGKISGVRHDWTFDEMYSDYATTGLGDKGKPPTRAQLDPLAKINVESLGEFDFFTFAKQSGRRLEFDAPKDYWLEANEKRIITLHFTLPLKTPTAAQKPVNFQIYDPTFFVSFDLEKQDPVALGPQAPSGCSKSIIEPIPLTGGDSQRLSAAASENFSPGAELSIKLAARIIIACS